MSTLSMIKTAQEGYADIHNDDYYFSNATFDEIGKNEELTKFFLNDVDPTGEKYGGDVTKAKSDFLNQHTFKANSIWSGLKGWVTGGNLQEEEKQRRNFRDRMYETAPNRLLGSDGVGGAAQALGYGLAGGVVGEDGGDLAINTASTFASMWLGAKIGGVAGTAAGPVGTAVGGGLGALTGGALALFGRNMVQAGTKNLSKEAALQMWKQLGKKGYKEQLVKEVAHRYGVNTAKAEFAVNGFLGAIGGLAEEGQRENIGRSEGELSDYLLSAGSGGLMAGAIGGALGYAGARFGEGRRLGKELVQNTRKGQQIMPNADKYAGEGPDTYREALRRRLDEIAEEEQKTPEMIAEELRLKQELQVEDRYRLTFTDDDKTSISDTRSNLAIQLRQEANNLDVFPDVSGHSAEKARAVADMLDNLPDFVTAQREVIEAQKAYDKGATPDTSKALTLAKERYNALKSIGQYFLDHKYDQRESVYSLLDDATFMDFAKNLDEGVRDAIIKENKLRYGPNDPGASSAPATPSNPKSPSGGGGSSIDMEGARKNAEALRKKKSQGASATQILDELESSNASQNPSSAWFGLKPEDLAAFGDLTWDDVKPNLKPETASTLEQLSKSSVKPDGTPSNAPDNVLDVIKSVPQDQAQYQQMLTNLSQQSGLNPQQIDAALRDAVNGFTVTKNSVEERIKKLKAQLQEILKLAQELSNKNKNDNGDGAGGSGSGTGGGGNGGGNGGGSGSGGGSGTPPSGSGGKTPEQIAKEAEARRKEIEAQRILDTEEKKAIVKDMSERVFRIRAVHDERANRVLGLITPDVQTLADLKESVPNELQYLVEGVTDLATAKAKIMENAENYADMTIISSVKDVVGVSDMNLFCKVLSLMGSQADTVRISGKLKKIIENNVDLTLLNGSEDAMNGAISAAIDNSLLPLKGARKGVINTEAEVLKYLPQGVSDEIKGRAIQQAKRIVRALEKNAKFKRLGEEAQNSIKVKLIENRVRNYLERRKEWDTAVKGIKEGAEGEEKKALEAMLTKDPNAKFDTGADLEAFFDDARYLDERLDEIFNRYRETTSLTPRQKETRVTPIYDANGNLVDVKKPTALLDKDGRLMYVTRTRVVPFSTNFSEGAIRKNYELMRDAAVKAATNQKASKATLATVKRLVPGYDSTSGKGLTEKEATGLIWEGMYERVMNMREDDIMGRLRKNMAEGTEDLDNAAFDAVAQKFNGVKFTDMEKSILKETARIQHEHANQIAELQKVMASLFEKEVITGREKILFAKLNQHLDRMLKEQGIVLEQRKKSVKDRVNFKDGKGASPNDPKVLTAKDIVLKEDTNEVYIRDKKVGTFRKDAEGNIFITFEGGKELVGTKDVSTIGNRNSVKRALRKVERELNLVPDEDSTPPGGSTGQSSSSSSSSSSGEDLTSADDQKIISVMKSRIALVESEGKGKIQIDGRDYGMFTRNSNGEIIYTTPDGKSTLQPAKSLEDLLKRKKFISVIKKAAADSGLRASTAKDVLEEISEEAFEELLRRSAASAAEEQRSIADSLSMFTTDDMSRPITDYYKLVSEDQLVVARIDKGDGTVSWRVIGLNRNNPDEPIGRAIGRGLYPYVVQGSIRIMGVTKKAKGAIDDAYCQKNAFYLKANGKSGNTDPGYLADKRIKEALNARIEAIKDKIGNDDPITYLKAQEYPLEESDLTKVFFRRKTDGYEVDGLSFVLDFEKKCQDFRITEGMTRDQYEIAVAQLNDMAQQISEKLPCGYRRKNASRITSTSGIINRMSKLNRSEQLAVLRSLQQLDVKLGPNNMPYFYAATENDSTPSGFGFDLHRGAGKKNPNSDVILAPKDEGMYWSPAVAHELLHWGYANLLTPQEKTQFLANVGKKYFDSDGNIDFALIKQLQGESTEPLSLGKPGHSVQEIFAYEGTVYYGDRLKKQAEVAADSFWDSLVSRFKDFMNWIQGFRNNISEENVKLFEKILPAEYNGNRYERNKLYSIKEVKQVNIDTLPADNKGLAGLRIVNNVEDHRSKIYSAMFDPNSTMQEKLDAMRQAGNYLKGFIHGRKSGLPSEFTKTSRGKILGYVEKLNLEGRPLVRMEMKMRELLFRNGKDKKLGTLLEHYKEQSKLLGASEKDAKEIAENQLINRGLGEGDDAYNNEWSLANFNLNEDAEARFGDAVTPEEAIASWDPTPEEQARISASAQAASIEWVNNIRKQRGEPPVNSFQEIQALGNNGFFSKEEIEQFLDVYQDAMDKAVIEIAEEVGLITRKPNTAHGLGDAGAIPAGRIDSTRTQEILSRLYDVLTDIEDDVHTRMEYGGYKLVPNERFRDGLAPAGEGGSGNPPSSKGQKTVEGNIIQEAHRALEAFGFSDNGVSGLTRPGVKAQIDEISAKISSSPQLGYTSSEKNRIDGTVFLVRRLLSRYGELLDKPDFTFGDLNALMGGDWLVGKEDLALKDQIFSCGSCREELLVSFEKYLCNLAWEQKQSGLAGFTPYDGDTWSMPLKPEEISRHLKEFKQKILPDIERGLSFLWEGKEPGLKDDIINFLFSKNALSQKIGKEKLETLYNNLPEDLKSEIVNECARIYRELAEGASLGADKIDFNMNVLDKSGKFVGTNKGYIGILQPSATYSERALEYPNPYTAFNISEAEEFEPLKKELITYLVMKAPNGDAVTLPMKEVIENVHSNLIPKDPAYDAFTSSAPDLDKPVFKFNPIVGTMAAANQVGLGQKITPTAVQLAMLHQGATPVQASLSSHFIPSRVSNWYKDSTVHKLMTSMSRGLDTLLASNVKRTENLGAKMLSDFGRTFYEEKSLFAGQYLPKLQEMSERVRGISADGKGKLRTQVSRDMDAILNGLVSNNHLGRVTDQEKGIIDFMRTATNSNWQKKWDKLTADQKNYVKELNRVFEDIRQKMLDVGLPVNDYRGMNGLLHYIPQRFNRDWVQANQDKFIDGMTKFFQSEGKGAIEAKDTAMSLYSHVVSDHEFAGFAGSDPTFARKSGEGLYSRVLNFKPEHWEQFGLTDMFDNNLEALARDYVDHAATLIGRAKRWGIEGHGRTAYFSVYADGINGAVAVLTSNKEMKKSILSGGNNTRLLIGADTELFNAFTQDKAEAREIARGIEAALDRGTPVETIVKMLVDTYQLKGGKGVMHFRREMDCLVNGIKDFGLDTGPNAKVPLNYSRYLVEASDLLTGMRGAPKDDVAAIGWLTAINNMTMLAMATVASLSDVGLIAIRAGTVMPYLKGVTATLKQMAGGDEATRAAIRSLGVAFECDRSANFLNNNSSRIQGMNNAYFRATGLTQWTAFSREMSANVAFEAVKCWQRQAREAIARGQQDSMTYRQAMFWLRNLGLNDPQFINGTPLTTLTDLRDACKADPSLKSMADKISIGMIKFVNESAFAPNRADIPAWAQSGFGRLIFQFKSYPLMLGRLTRWCMESARWKNGANFKPLLLLATLGVGMGAGGQAVRDIIQGRNIDYEDEEQSFSDMHSIKERLASEICRQMGWDNLADALEDTTMDKIIGWYAAGVMGLGALGVVGDFAMNLTEETNNGAFGELNVLKQLLGPSLGDVMDAWHVSKTGYNMVTEGIGLKSERPSNRDERRAFGAITSRVPIIGGIRSVNRSLKDYLVPLEEEE